MEDGGINMHFLDEAIAAAGIQFLRRRAEGSEHRWTDYMDWDYGQRGGYQYLNCKKTAWDFKKLDFLPYNMYIPVLKCWDIMRKAL